MLLDEQSTHLAVRFGDSRGFLWTCQGDHPKMAQYHVSCSLLCAPALTGCSGPGICSTVQIRLRREVIVKMIRAPVNRCEAQVRVTCYACHKRRLGLRRACKSGKQETYYERAEERSSTAAPADQSGV